jgi:hypothetical protein
MEATEAQQQAEMAYELARLRRVGLFSTFVAGLMLSYLVFPLVVPMFLLMGGMIYMFWPCISMLWLAKEDRTSIFEDPTAFDEDNDDEDMVADEPILWKQIRLCKLPRPTGKDPPEGIYSVVYAGEYFGRALRTEGELHLKWQARPNGWEVKGHTTSAATTTSPIKEGFLNSEGNLYWISESTSTGDKTIVYSGHFDLESHQMHEGEFFSQDGALQGRIIRMELMKATSIELKEATPTPPTRDKLSQTLNSDDWATTDIEMIGVKGSSGRDIRNIA